MSDGELLEKIYAAAVQLTDPEARTRYLSEACGGNDALRRQVEALLETHGDSQSVVPEFMAETAGQTSDEIWEKTGDQVGPYRLQERLGEGGFGVVFAAEQTSPVQRRVALKILKPGMDARQFVRRFDLERQALARMEHPHIARILDAGATERGRPYFAMELVNGQPITVFCDQNAWRLEERMRLFVKVCRAVHHAHQKGVIHRDLKPSNVLVDWIDGEAQPRIIDFGIAKAMEQKPDGASVQTLWHQFLGTPLYMSPEQTRLGELDIDTRSDVYSLGILLYELLAGVTPLDADNACDPEGWRRRIGDAAVIKPSTRLARLPAGRLAEIAPRRRASPRELSRMLRGDIDWIVLKATEAERERRYDSAESFAKDVERFLAHLPIEARPPSALYQTRKFVRRHRLLVAAGGAVSVALLVGLAAAIWGAGVARKESQTARAEERKARELVSLLFRSFVKVVPAEGGRPDFTVREMLAELARIADSGELKSEEVECSVRDMLSYFALELGDFEGARKHATKGLALARKPGGDPREAATFHARLGRVLKDAGSHQPALEHFQQSLEINRRLYGPDHPTTVRGMLQAARGQQQSGNESAGVALAEQALRVARGHAGKAWHDDQLVRCLHMAAIIYQHAGRYLEQEALLQERLELVRRRGGADSPETLHALADLGVLRFQQRRFSESESLLVTALEGQRRRLGDDYPQTFETMIALARCRAALHQTNEARALFDEALDRSASALGANSPYRRDCLKNAIEFFEANGDATRAAALAEEWRLTSYHQESSRKQSDSQR